VSEVDAAVEALVTAAAEVLIAAELPVDSPVAGLAAPCPIVVSPVPHGVGAPGQQVLHVLGQLRAVLGFGGDVMRGAGPLVAGADDVADELGGLGAGTAAGDMYTGLLVGVFVLGFPGDPFVEGRGRHGWCRGRG